LAKEFFVLAIKRVSNNEEPVDTIGTVGNLEPNCAMGDNNNYRIIPGKG